MNSTNNTNSTGTDSTDTEGTDTTNSTADPSPETTSHSRESQRATRSTARRAATVGVLGLACIGVIGSGALAVGDDEPTQTDEPLVVEVSEDASRFVFDDAPLFDDGLPAYGNSFVTQGYIYEEGTLADGGGVNPDGTPTHPDAVLGTWTCEGFFIGDGARTSSGPWVITTQVFDFGELDGDDTIVSHGIELSDAGVEVGRAIVGGTGDHAGAAGVQNQTLEGFNDAEGVNLSVTFEPS